jgi:hypothetical protein
MMMRGPRSSCGSDDNSVLIGRHDVLHVRRHEEKAADRITLHLRAVANGQFQHPLDNRDPCVGAVRVSVMIPSGNERGIGECLPVCVGVALENGPLRSVLVCALPLNCFRVPGLRDFLFLGRADYGEAGNDKRQRNYPSVHSSPPGHDWQHRADRGDQFPVWCEDYLSGLRRQIRLLIQEANFVRASASPGDSEPLPTQFKTSRALGGPYVF